LEGGALPESPAATTPGIDVIRIRQSSPNAAVLEII